MKRDSSYRDVVDAGDAKAPRMGINFTEAREGQWTCEECGNINFADRGTCNRRHCGAPRKIIARGNFQVPKEGQWVCPACENINFADRMFCNRRGCNAPRPGGSKGKGKGMNMMSLSGGMTQPMMGKGVTSKGMGKMGSFKGGFNAVSPKIPVPMTRSYVPQKVGKGNFSELRDGQWVCELCENINFADRDVCNRRGCGAPKPNYGRLGSGLLSYAPSPAGEGTNFTAPRADQWVCPECNNINFADREVCNRKSCGAPRPSDQESAAAAEKLESMRYGVHQVGTGNFQVAREGQWVCRLCKNINFADREVCNRRECEAPKEGL